MLHKLRLLAAFLAAFGLVVANGSALAQKKDKDKDKGHEQKAAQTEKSHADKPDKSQTDKPAKVKKAKHESGKALVGDKIKKDGSHKIQDHGKASAFVNVKGGKVAGVKVKHAEKGDLKVTKYKTTKKMAAAPSRAVAFASYSLNQQEYIDTVWIGYGYIDDWGEEVIYWFPYDMIYDGDTGAIEYYPAY